MGQLPDAPPAATAHARIMTSTQPESFQVSTEAAEFYESAFVPAFFAQWAPIVCTAAEIGPGQTVLDVACGTGIVARTAADLVGPGGPVVGLDLNDAMLTVARRVRPDVDWRRGSADALPFDAESFDCAVAAWMLYHVAGLDRGLAELARVLRPGGRLVAVTNAGSHLKELLELSGRALPASPFSRENGEEILLRHFDRVERRDADGWVTIPDRAAVERYLESWKGFEPAGPLPAFETPLRVRRASTIFVATR